jgi:hypothetical protein
METLSKRSFKIAKELYLVQSQVINKNQKVVKKHEATNHVFCCDVSGSMYRSIPKMREQLKARIKELLHADDTITIIAFADGRDCYVVKECAPVKTANDIKVLNAAIDKYLQVHCCTDFVLPIDATNQILKNHTDAKVWNWIFLSDGGHNCGPFTHVVSALEKIQDQISNATIIEYGYYADSKRLSEMAAQLGGTKIPAEDFNSYVPVIESSLSGSEYSPKVEIKIDFVDSLKYNQMFYLDQSGKSIHVISPDEDGKIYLPMNVKEFYSISKKIVGEKTLKSFDPSVFYAGAYVMADLLHYDVVESILNSLHDVKFISMYQDSFGKQKLFAFQTEILEATFNKKARGKIDPKYKAVEGKYCIVDFLNDLMSGDNLIKVASPDFTYSRIGAKAVDKIELTKSDKKALKDAKTKKDADKVMKSVQSRVPVMHMVDKGYPVSDFTWNEERANLSILTKIDVDLDLPKNTVGLTRVKSFVFRNFTVIKDGILNMNQFPVILDTDTFNAFQAQNLSILNIKALGDGHTECIVDVSSLPVINKKKVRASKMKKMTKLALQLNDYKFELKYLGYLKKELNIAEAPESTPEFSYNEKQVAYLESLGITPKGYNPKVEQDKTGDFYMAMTLNSTFKGFTTIPPIESIDKKLKSGKTLTVSEEYLKNVMNYIDSKYLSKLKGDAYLNAVKSAFTQLTIKKRKVAEQLSQMKFAMIISRKWFSDCESFDQNTDTITSDFGPELTIEYRFTEKKQNL